MQVSFVVAEVTLALYHVGGRGKVVLQLSPLTFGPFQGVKLAACLFKRALVRKHLIIHRLEVPKILRDGGIKRHQRMGELFVCEVVSDDAADLNGLDVLRHDRSSCSQRCCHEHRRLLYPLNNLRNILNDHLVLHSKNLNYVMGHLLCKELLLMDLFVCTRAP